MIAVIISWVTIFFILFSVGHIFITGYNRICKTDEKYNNLDTFILGLCSILIPLQISSLWLPSNQYILLLYIIVSILYWIYNYKELKKYISCIKETLDSLSSFQKGAICITIISLTVYFLFLSDFSDAEYYHHQNTRWNEEFAVVPGLGNIEDRFGFNSSYLLISAIFSFRFIFGEAVYQLQALLYVMLLVWACVSFIKSKFDYKYVFVIGFLIVCYLMGDTLLDNTSTDIIPILCIFYFIVKSVLDPEWLRKQPLLAFVLPVTLITFKLSTGLFCLVCIIPLIHLFSEKKYSSIVFLVASSLLIIGLWCIRNAIITGYLIYPVHEIDLFSFDWKMPPTILILERIHIHEWAVNMFKQGITYKPFLSASGHTKIFLFYRILNWICCLLVVTSPITTIYCFLKKKSIHIFIYFIYTLSLTCIIFNMLSAPDFRFMFGYIWGCGLIHLYFILLIIKPKELQAKTSNILLLIFIFTFCFFSYEKRARLVSYIYNESEGKLPSIIVQPIPHPRSYEANKRFDEYKMGTLIIFLTKEPNGKTFDILPATNPTGLPFTPFDGNKIQSIKTIENRGNSLQDGFRTKDEYLNLLESNTPKYKEEYLNIFYERYYPQ